MSQNGTAVTNRMLSDENMEFQFELDNLKTFLVSEPVISGINVPRFGMYSIFGRSIPMYAFDNPQLSEKFPTAFTDGSNVFYNTKFMDLILSDPAGGRNGMTFLTLHEIGHSMFRHFHRLLDYPHDIANVAQDMSMNTRMIRDFVKNPDSSHNILFPLSPALECGVGFKEGDIEKYAHRSEEDIAREMMKERDEMIEEMMKNGAGQPSSSGQKGQGQGGGMSIPGMGDPEAGMGTDHMISPEDFAQILKDAGLGHIIEKLDLPVDKNGNLDPDKMQKVIDRHEQQAQAAVTTMNSIADLLGGRMPGAHSHDYAKQMLGKLNAPKVSWKTAAKQLLVGNGMKMSNSFDHPGDAYMIDPANMGIPNRLYIGARVPSKPAGFNLCLMDTSGSMTSDDTWMREATSEVLGIVSANKQNACDVIFLQIDTVVRGEAMVITPSNVDMLMKQAMEARGLGGTSLTTGINMAMEHPEVKRRLAKKEKINALMYFTDLGDASPKREDLPKNLPKKVVYMAVPGTYNDQFASDVSDYATVVSMGKRMTVDLTGDKPSISGMRSRRP